MKLITVRLVVIAALALVALGGAASSTSAASRPVAAAAASAITVKAGVNTVKDPNVAVLEFLPEVVTIASGTSVTWSWADTIEPHSVTFFPTGTTPPPPGSDEALFAPTPGSSYFGTALVNSGLQPLGDAPPPAFSVSFPEVGDFTYYCVIHPNMTGTVKVVAPDQKYDTAAAVAARGKKEALRWTAEGLAAKKKLESTKPVRTKGADGTSTWDVEMGATTEHTDVLAFAPAPTKIKHGDSIRFVNNSQAPHTGTFRGGQPGIVDPTAPETSTPIPGPSPQTLNATDLFNTGELAPDAGSPAPPIEARSFTFVVPTAGKYPFYCILHLPSGMATNLQVS
jgi:plastocyanin